MQSKPVVIGISGGSGAGKSFFSEALLNRLGGRSNLIQMDSFFQDFSQLTPDQLRTTNFDEPSAYQSDALERAITQLVNNQEAQIPVYDLESSRVTGAISVKPAPIIIVEGLLLFCFDSLVNLMDLLIYIDAPEEIRVRRQLQRLQQQARGPIEERRIRIARFVLPSHAQYVEPTKAKADLVFSNHVNDYSELSNWLDIVERRVRVL